jgi:hypothetical protein
LVLLGSELLSLSAYFTSTAVGVLLCDELKDDASVETYMEKVVEVGSGTNITLISEEGQGIKDKSVSFSLFCLSYFAIN